MKRTLLTTAAMTLLATTAMADGYSAMPKKFQGTWIDAEGGVCPLIVRANTISVCGPSEPFKLISIEAGDEELTSVIVKWKSNPNALAVDQVYRLIKINGRLAMIEVNADAPTIIGLYWKK